MKALFDCMLAIAIMSSASFGFYKFWETGYMSYWNDFCKEGEREALPIIGGSRVVMFLTLRLLPIFSVFAVHTLSMNLFCERTGLGTFDVSQGANPVALWLGSITSVVTFVFVLVKKYEYDKWNRETSQDPKLTSK
jgi:hypothetical protein